MLFQSTPYFPYAFKHLFTINSQFRYESVRITENGLERDFVKHWAKLSLTNWPHVFDIANGTGFKKWKSNFKCRTYTYTILYDNRIFLPWLRRPVLRSQLGKKKNPLAPGVIFFSFDEFEEKQPSLCRIFQWSSGQRRSGLYICPRYFVNCAPDWDTEKFPKREFNIF